MALEHFLFVSKQYMAISDLDKNQKLAVSIPILYEDEQLLVINKPAGITVNISDTTQHQTTVQDWVQAYLNIEVPKVSGVPKVPNENRKSDPSDTFDTSDTFYSRGGIVHRLDKETSGVMLIAKTAESFQALQKQFKDRVVEKTYLALAHGFFPETTGEITVPVGRLPWNRKRFGVIPGGRESVTYYTVLDKYVISLQKKEAPVSLLRLFPKTGRTHQIRVHLKHVGHPIFSDFLYAGRKTARDDRKLLDRVFLHAASITFSHPTLHKKVTINSKLPDDLAKILSVHAKERL